MVPILHPLPLDLTGQAETNVIRSEKHNLVSQADLPFKIIVMEKGYFYQHDFQMRDHLNKPLQHGSDYQFIAMQSTITKDIGLPAFGIVVVKNEAINKSVSITARMVGGEYCSLTDAVIHQAESLLAGGKRKVYWKNLIGKPDDYRPNGHQHAYWELFGFTPPTQILKRMSVAQNTIAAKSFEGLYNEWRIKFNQLGSSLDAIEATLTAHIANRFDPHAVTKLQVGLDKVFNGPPATMIEATTGNGSLMTTYATPVTTKAVITTNFTPRLNQHINDRNNPHGVTYATLGAYNAVMLNALYNQYYPRGSTVTASYKMVGLTWQQVKDNVRTNVPIDNIVSGNLPWNMYTSTPPEPDTFFVPTTDGRGGWKKIKTIIEEYGTKGNQILYMAGNFRYPEIYTWKTRQWYTGIEPIIRNTMGVDYPNGTMCVFRWTGYWSNGTGNGTYQWTTTAITMMICQDKRWIAPGFDIYPSADASPKV